MIQSHTGTLTRRIARLLAAGVAVAGVAAGLLAFGSHGTASAASDAFDPTQKAAIEGIIKDYLLKNPEILIDMQAAYEKKAEEARNAAAAKALAEHGKELYANAALPTIGATKGNVTVVEFFDYNCPHCRDAIDPLVKLVDTDKNVRVVFVDLSIIGHQVSEETAKVVLAAQRQGKYWEMHRALMEKPGQVTRDTALKIGETLGLDMAKLKKDMDSPEVAAQLKANDDLRNNLAIEGTPHFIVDDKTIDGAPDNLYDQLASLVGGVRKTGCKYC